MEFQKYFQSYEDYFWEWDNQIFSEDSVFESLTIPNGQTIGYEKFIFEILEYLSEDSIPPFGTLLLALVATNPDSENAIEMIHDLVRSKNIVTAFPQSQSFRIGASIDFLKLLSDLPNEYKVGEKRMKLFQTIFYECHNRVSSEKAKNLLEEYKDHRHHLVRAGVKDPFNEANFRKELRTLALLKVKFPTVQSVLNAMENIPHYDLNEKLNEEVLEEKNLSDKVTDFVDQLIEEDKTFHVGSLIKRLWSGLNIPLHHNHPSEQPLGGISDLTNKGDFDKLVISEFAYDDDVFMSRIANNEALYIQREVPPEGDKFKRILLIDHTLKNWGNPKILAFASAIAIARHPKTDIECQVYVVSEAYKEVSVENVYEVINALGELSGKLDCSAGLDSFFAANKINSKNQEVFLFSSEESLKLTPMQNAMSTYFNDIKYVFAIGMQDISVFKNQNKGKKLLQHIIMPLDELWVSDNTNKKQRVRQIEITDESIPLLYPVERSYQNIFSHDNEFYMYMNGNLFMFSDTRFAKGFVKVASNLPYRNGNFAMKTNSKGEKILWYHYYDLKHYASTINLSTKELKNYSDFNEKINVTALKVFEYQNDFYFAGGMMDLLPNFWQIAGDFSLTVMRNEKVRQASSNNLEVISSFINNYKKNKVKYTVIKKLNSVVIEKNSLKFNDFYISNVEFQKARSYFRRDDEAIKFEERVNLILKNRGISPLAVVKAIKANADKTLKEVHEIIDEQFSVILKNVTKDAAEKLKKEIEKNGAVCYIETQYFQSEDGSKITNQDGILVFESSDTRIEKFYIPFVINMRTIMATEDEYAGNDYFIPGHTKESMSDEVFIEKHFKPFILNIVHHGA